MVTTTNHPRMFLQEMVLNSQGMVIPYASHEEANSIDKAVRA